MVVHVDGIDLIVDVTDLNFAERELHNSNKYSLNHFVEKYDE